MQEQYVYIPTWLLTIIPIVALLAGIFIKVGVSKKTIQTYGERIEALEQDHDTLIEVKNDVKWLRSQWESIVKKN